MTIAGWIENTDVYFENGLVSFLVTSLAVLVIAYVVRFLARYTVRLLIKRQKVSESMIKFISHILLALLYTVSIMSILMQIVPFREYTVSILAGSGIAVLVLGFAAQETFSNLIAGVFISVFRPFSVGDSINLPDRNIAGIVEDINLRHTTVRNFNNNRVMIPNGVMNTAIVENKDSIDRSVYSYLFVTIKYESDVETAVKIMVEKANRFPLVLRKEETNAIVMDLGLNGIQLRLAFWAKDAGDAFNTSTALRKDLVDSFREVGIEFATVRVG
ncbi:MAG: mechanosensitive ion channel family protein [Erysipelotrichaceae bacterium]